VTRASVVALALALLPAEALAQTRAFNAYRAPMSAADLLATERAMVTPHLRFGAVAVVDYAPRTPLRVGEVAHRATLHGAVTFGLFDRLQLGVGVPLVITQDGGAQYPSPELGDLAVDARVRIGGEPARGVWRLALAATLTAPTGPGYLAAPGQPTVTPRVLFELNHARNFVFAVNAGARVRPGTSSLATARVGVSVALRPRVLLTGEAALETPLDDFFAEDTTSLELLAGLHGTFRSGLVLGAGVGRGLLRGEGAAADFRALALVGYAWQRPDEPVGPGDRDADGVLDADDACPDEPAGARPDPARRGCPRHDRDRDGVDDANDQCPDLARGDDPDPERNGCPRDDRDGDGVRDRDDQCPLEPAGERADREHRGCPLLDGDHDGFPDGEDQCPLEPAGAHPDHEHRGCPDNDIDDDRVANASDACPEEPGPRTNDPQTSGCPRVYVRGERVVIQQQPRFATGRAVILPESFALLGEVAAALEAHPELARVEVGGHTDDVGDDPRNLTLSEARARSVMDWLVGHGIAAARLSARGYGESRPIVDNATARGRAMNRRVEFVIVERVVNPPAP
jgi:OOP family OmpA-OmpF porin